MKTKTPLVKAFETMGIAHKNLSKTVNGITGTNYITIYGVLKESGIKATRGDCNSIGMSVSKQIESLPERRLQIENWGRKDKHYQVRQYAESKRADIEQIIVSYFSKKK